MNKRIKSFGYAIRGIRVVFGTEPNMKIHIWVTLIVILSGFLFSISNIEWMLCLICVGLVMGAEMMNTAIENVVDLITSEHNELAGKAKDIAAGGVLICTIVSVIIGLIIFVPKILNFVSFYVFK